jgi:replication factor A1
LDPKQLIDAFFQAWKSETSHCGNLQISRRDINEEHTTFLITKEGKAIWQFPVNLESIGNSDARNDVSKISIPEAVKKSRYDTDLKIGDLRYGMKGITVKAKMIEIPPAKLVITRWGSSACVSNVTIADDTGTIQLGLWNDQIEKVNVGDEVELTNCRVARFANEPQLRLGRKSTISVINQLQKEEPISYPLVR